LNLTIHSGKSNSWYSFQDVRTQPEIRSMAPLTGQNTAEILANWVTPKPILKDEDAGFVKTSVIVISPSLLGGIKEN